MKEPPKKNKKEANIFEQALDWEASKNLQIQKSARVAWIVAGLSLFLCALSVFAVAALTPLKTVVPYVIKVDNSTGIVEVASTMTDSKTNYEERVNTYFLKLYVRFREGYSQSLVKTYYENVGYLSGNRERAAYSQWMNPDNPESPIVRYGDNATVKIDFKSVTFLAEDVAIVRYLRTIKDITSVSAQTQNETATIKFTYINAKINGLEAEINPLGFQVLEYRVDEDGEARIEAQEEQ